MVQRKGGIRRKTRYKFKKGIRQKSKISITNYLQTFNPGDRVYLSLESAVQKGMYHPNFVGKCGVVKDKRGKCYEVTIKDRRKLKDLIVHPVHLKRF